MNYSLLIKFLIVEAVEFSLFWLIAGWIPLPFSQVTKFFILLSFDIAVTELVFPGAIGILINEIFKKPN